MQPISYSFAEIRQIIQLSGLGRIELIRQISMLKVISIILNWLMIYQFLLLCFYLINYTQLLEKDTRFIKFLLNTNCRQNVVFDRCINGFQPKFHREWALAQFFLWNGSLHFRLFRLYLYFVQNWMCFFGIRYPTQSQRISPQAISQFTVFHI